MNDSRQNLTLVTLLDVVESSEEIKKCLTNIKLVNSDTSDSALDVTNEVGEETLNKYLVDSITIDNFKGIFAISVTEPFEIKFERFTHVSYEAVSKFFGKQLGELKQSDIASILSYVNIKDMTTDEILENNDDINNRIISGVSIISSNDTITPAILVETPQKQLLTLRDYQAAGVFKVFPSGFEVYDYDTAEDITESFKKYLDCKVEAISPSPIDCCVVAFYVDTTDINRDDKSDK